MQEKMLALLEQVRQEIQTSVDGLTEAQRAAPGSPERWAAKDSLSHSIEWARRFLDALDGIAELADFASNAEMDAENRRIYDLYHPQSWESVLATVDRVYADMAGRLRNFSAETLLACDVFPSQGGRPLWRQIAGYFYTHPLLHLGYDYLARGDRASVLRLNEQAARELSALDTSPAWRGTTLYNLGCSCALMGEKERAITLLAQALHLEPGLTEWSKQDTDLDSLRNEPAFEALYAQS